MLGQHSLFKPNTDLPLRRRVELQQVSLQDAADMLVRFHYLHRTRVGRQINYAVLLDGVIDGVITYAYPMMTSALEGVPSDEILEFARLYLHSNTPHVATCAIGKSLKRIRADWTEKFPDAKPPRLVVSWSDKEYHKGTIYKAANFKRHGDGCGGHCRTAKSGSSGGWGGSRRALDDYKHIKDRWVYWLTV